MKVIPVFITGMSCTLIATFIVATVCKFALGYGMNVTEPVVFLGLCSSVLIGIIAVLIVYNREHPAVTQ